MDHAHRPVPQSPTRVIHVINGEHYSGAERVEDLLAGCLGEFGYEVTFACLKRGQFAARRQYREAAIHALPMSGRIDLRPAFSLARLVRQQEVKLLHAHTPRSLMIARLAAFLTAVPLVYHVHSPTARDSTRALQNWLNNKTERFSLGGVDRLITVSASLARHMREEGVAAERIVAVPNGVPAHGPLPQREVPQEPWTIGTVALLRPRKGLEVLLRAVALLRDQALPIRLRVVGGFETRPYETTIRELTRQLGIVETVDWVGFSADVPAELQKMDLFVLPSLFGEGLPMVVLEAMAAGVPVVASRVEGVPEALGDGVDGVLVEPDRVDALAEGIRRIVEQDGLWSALRQSAHARQAAHFSDRRMAEQVANIYQTILSPRCEGSSHAANILRPTPGQR